MHGGIVHLNVSEQELIHKYAHKKTHTCVVKECYSSGMAQVAEGCQDVSLEGDLHEDQGGSDKAIAYL